MGNFEALRQYGAQENPEASYGQIPSWYKSVQLPAGQWPTDFWPLRTESHLTRLTQQEAGLQDYNTPLPTTPGGHSPQMGKGKSSGYVFFPSHSPQLQGLIGTLRYAALTWQGWLIRSKPGRV